MCGPLCPQRPSVGAQHGWAAGTRPYPPGGCLAYIHRDSPTGPDEANVLIQLKARVPFPERTAYSSVQINFYINPRFVLACLFEYIGSDRGLSQLLRFSHAPLKFSRPARPPCVPRRRGQAEGTGWSARAGAEPRRSHGEKCELWKQTDRLIHLSLHRSIAVRLLARCSTSLSLSVGSSIK